MTISTLVKLHLIVYADDVILLAQDYHALQRMFDMLQSSFASIGLQFDPDKTAWLSLEGPTPGGDGVPSFVESMTWLGILWQKGDYNFDSTAKRRQQFAQAAQYELVGDVVAAQLLGNLPSCRVVWMAMVQAHLITMGPAWGMQHFKVQRAWRHAGMQMLARYLRKVLGLSRHVSNIALALEAGLWPPVVLVARRVNDMWAAAQDSDNVLLRAAAQCETALCEQGSKCWLRMWLTAFQCELADIKAGHLADKVAAACVGQVEAYCTAPIHEDKCAERHIAMYVQQFAHVTPIGKVPRHHSKFKLPWRVLHQYINIATGNVKLPAYDAGYGIPFTARHCPLCEPNKVCTVYHLLSDCSFMQLDTLDDDDGEYTPDRSGASMQQWLQNNYSADGIRFLVAAVSRFQREAAWYT